MIHVFRQSMVGHELSRFVDLSTAAKSDGQSSSAADTPLAACLSEQLECGVCLNVLAEAVDTRCGHTFCRQCLDQWLRSCPPADRVCPECRQRLSGRKRSATDSKHSFFAIVGDDVLVHRNRRLNAMVARLRIRCDYRWNGCPEVVSLDTMAAHVKTCPHTRCHTCALPVQRWAPDADHNCLQLLKNAVNEWPTKYANIESECKSLAEKCVDLEARLKTAEAKSREAERQYLQELAALLAANGPKLSVTRAEFGTYVASVTDMEVADEGLRLRDIPANGANTRHTVLIPYANMRRLKVYSNYSIANYNGLCVEPIAGSMASIQQCLRLGSESSNWHTFDSNSDDPSICDIDIELSATITESMVEELFQRCRRANSQCEFLRYLIASANHQLMSRFDCVERAPGVETFDLNRAFAADTRHQKVDLGIGDTVTHTLTRIALCFAPLIAYRTDEGKPWVLPVVRKAVVEILTDESLDYEYLGQLGDDLFAQSATKLLLGDGCQAIDERRAFGIQCLSGTGALRIGADFLYRSAGFKTVYISDPSWCKS
ncbi:unnamed protein product, partial [Medioppia subpectinata]